MRLVNVLGISAVCGGCFAAVAGLIALFGGTAPPFGEPEWAVILLDVVLVAAPVVAATLVVERLIKRGRP
jgi:hypothetical protein